MSHSRTRSLSFLLPLAALSITLVACGDDSTSSNDSSAVTTVAAPADTAAADTTPDDTTPDETTDDYYTGDDPVPTDTASSDTGAAAGSATLQLAETSLGTILVDSEGNTLYLFGNDTPNTPTCDTGCLGNWPALVSDGAATVGEGLQLEDVGTVTAADGSTQATFYGHPLYLFAGDAAPGDVSGQGIGGAWFVVDAEGNAIK